METKYKEITTQNYFAFTRFLQGKVYKGRIKHLVNHNAGSLKKNSREEPCVSLILGRGSKGGGVVVGEHVRRKTGFCVCDILA